MKFGEWRPAQWWLPGQADTWKVPGTYELLMNGAAKATLFKDLKKGRQRIIPSKDDSNISLLHGDCFGKAVTLVRSRSTSYRGNLGELRSAAYLPWLALEGLFLSEDELQVSDAVITLHDQQLWAQRTAFKPEFNNPETDWFPSAVRHVEIPDSTAVLQGGSITIEDRSVYHPEKNSTIKLETRCVFKIALDEPVDIKQFMESWVHPLEVMIAAANGRIGGIESLRLTNKNWQFEPNVPDFKKWATVRVGSQVRADEKRKDLNYHDLLFSLHDIDWTRQGAAIFETIPKWSYVIEQWAMLLRPDYKWPVARFVSVVQAVEALDRLLIPDVQSSKSAKLVDDALATLKEAGFNNRERGRIKAQLRLLGTPSLEDRLKRRVKEMPSVMAKLTTDSMWPARVARLRNIVSHGLEDAHDREKVVMGSLVATDLLLHVLEATFLLNLNFTEEETADIMQRRNSFGWRCDRVREQMHWLPEA
ncbi:HEPN domain-containing protein [Actinomadura terrae]|uniref:ApeA N-terminal domain 1-containing protein n=1 Tax=Actinomadura terrae TaxID=604353 RepID=UPI001FA6D463|nr:HEPN domain-containing protein [Actinomadura terrae]